MKIRNARVSVLAIAAIAVACATDQQVLQSKQQMATQAALGRARWEMNCQDVTATVLSDEVTQPAIQGPYLSGVPRAEYTIGVAGCGQRDSFVVVCPEGGGGCFAATPRVGR